MSACDVAVCLCAMWLYVCVLCGCVSVCYVAVCLCAMWLCVCVLCGCVSVCYVAVCLCAMWLCVYGNFAEVHNDAKPIESHVM